MVEAGRFREDLYYRIHVIHLHIPPLRERKDDILWLAQRLLSTWATENSDPRSLHPAAEKALFDYPWPGNIRELKHCLERACILSRKTVITVEMLFGNTYTLPPSELVQSSNSLNEYLQSCERKYIAEALRINNGRIGDTAESLKISRKNLWQKMKKLQVQDSADPSSPEDISPPAN